MTHQFCKEPTWAGSEETDITGDAFADLALDGDTEVFALFHTTETNLGGHYLNRDIQSQALLDGVRVEHPGLTEWRDRNWLIGAYGADAVAKIDDFLTEAVQ